MEDYLNAVDENKPAVARTSSGLREALFDELDQLRSGKTNATKANATAKLAMAIVGTVEMELEVRKTLNKMPKGEPDLALPSLSLVSGG